MTKKRTDPRLSTGRNSRRQVFKYYHIDDDRRFAVKGGRCHRCNTITDAFCDDCHKWLCDNHLQKRDAEDYLCFCLNCVEKKVK